MGFRGSRSLKDVIAFGYGHRGDGVGSPDPVPPLSVTVASIMP